jgi:hypothetical protein
VPFENARRALEDMLAAARAGHGDDDFASLVQSVEERAGVRLTDA